MAERKLEHTRVAVLAEDLYEDLELWYPVLRLREEGAEVVLVGTGKSQYRGKHGYPVEVDCGIEEVAADEFDAVVIPGGYAPDRLRRVPKVLEFVARMHRSDKPVAAICHAAWVPISAGILKGRTVTCFHAIKDDVVNAGATYVDEEVVRDESLITSRKPSDLGAFCRTLIGALAERRVSSARGG